MDWGNVMKAEEIVKDFTTWLHEVFVYVLPASVCSLGAGVLIYRYSPSHVKSALTAYQRIDQGIDKALVLVVVFFILYCMGILIQSLSHAVIFVLTDRMACLLRRSSYFYSDVAIKGGESLSLKEKRKQSHLQWAFDQATVSANFPEIGKWSENEFSRLALTRSMSLVFLILTLLGIIVVDTVYSMIAFAAFVLTISLAFLRSSTLLLKILPDSGKMSDRKFARVGQFENGRRHHRRMPYLLHEGGLQSGGRHGMVLPRQPPPTQSIRYLRSMGNYPNL
jgi:hypothetical protein